MQRVGTAAVPVPGRLDDRTERALPLVRPLTAAEAPGFRRGQGGCQIFSTLRK